jgi:HAD superfamily hydrolase (TIGR01509 family)
MIDAVIFDLDGTLVQTELLKGISYARAALELRRDGFDEGEVFDAYAHLVGLPRREAAEMLLAHFGLEDAARARRAEFGVSTPWQAFVQVRLRIYESMLDDREAVRALQWPHNIALLQATRQTERRTALATMSYCQQTRRILALLELSDAFDFVATRDDVERGKPDPEIYLLVAHGLGVEPQECLVIEDSPNGVKAALAADMNVIAVTTPLTKRQFREEERDLLDRCWVVDDPQTLPEVVQWRIARHQQEVHGGASWS